MRLLGLDPGLQITGWGMIEARLGGLSHLGNGVVKTGSSDDLARRLAQLYEGLTAIVAEWQPDSAAVEETFVNRNPRSTLKLGQARGVVLLAPALAGIEVAEYAPNTVKKSVVGVGHADKEQIRAMVGRLLPGCAIEGQDAADALAVAICHAHHMETASRQGQKQSVGGNS